MKHPKKCYYCDRLLPPIPVKTCPHCGSVLPELIHPGKESCGNCHAYIGDDAYCRKCGTKAGEGKYEPYYNFESCVYGPPPIEREHECPNCGYEWTNCVMMDKDRYCPKCGSAVKVTEK